MMMVILIQIHIKALSLSSGHTLVVERIVCLRLRMERKHLKEDDLTKNQIDYNRLIEERRHNKASEAAETAKADAAQQQAATSARVASATAQHYAEQDRVNWWSAQEQQRANQERERTNWFTAENTARFQSAQSQAVLRQAAVSERQATVSEREAAVHENTLAESIRHNLVGEAETRRHNVRVENLTASQNAELVRSHMANEALQASYQSEIARSNRANELIAQTRSDRDFQLGIANVHQQSVRNQIAQQNADTNQQNADTSRAGVQYNYEVGSRQAGAAEVRASADVARTIISGVETAYNILEPIFNGGYRFGTKSTSTSTSIRRYD